MSQTTYDLNYFSGAQATVHIGEVMVDELAQLSFTLTQNKVPIYGYASQLYDAIAPGNVLVQGQFTINFKDSGYLFAILLRARRFSQKENTELARLYDEAFGKSSTGPRKNDAAKDIASRIAKGQFNDNLERTRLLLQLAENSLFAIDTSDPEHSTFRRSGLVSQRSKTSISRPNVGSIPQSAISNVTGSDGTPFNERILKNLEETIWGIDGGSNDTADRRFKEVKRVDTFPAIDVHIRYGTSLGTTHYKDQDGNIRATPKRATPSFTAKVIKKMNITGMSQTIDTSGQPIMETYSFLAREVK